MPKTEGETAKKTKKSAEPDESILKTAASAIGSALGTIAKKTHLAGGEADAPKKVSMKKGKLPKLNKERLPRKLKKQQKAKAAKL